MTVRDLSRLGWLVLALASPVTLANSDPFAADPFEADPFEADPFKKSADSETASDSHSRIEIKSYYQDNNLRDEHPFNPGMKLFDSSFAYVGLDAEFSQSWQQQWQAKARVYSRFLAGSSDIDNAVTGKDRYDSYLLEGLVQWQNQQRDIVIEFGRSKPQWSNGYSYDIANLLSPQRSQPYIDQDNPLQSKGWDMLSGQYFSGPWSLAGYLVASDTAPDNSGFIDADSEAVMRLGYQQDDAFSVLVHKIEGLDLSYAATYSTLLSDALTFRAELTQQSYRQLHLLPTEQPLQPHKQQSNYQRWVVGSTYTAAAGWTLTGEYFYNQHGANRQEWQQATEQAALSANKIRQHQSSNPQQDYKNSFAGLDFMRQGWLRQRYASLMFMSNESDNLWQLRLSSQISLDDDSQLHRIELLKAFNDNLSARLQWQLFNGCERCEYGLNPSEDNLRLTLSWLF